MGLVTEPKKWAFIASGGGGRGSFHGGSLKVIQKNKIPIDCFIGVSVGVLANASFVASGESADPYCEKFLSFKESTEIFLPEPSRKIGKIILTELLSLIKDTEQQKVLNPKHTGGLIKRLSRIYSLTRLLRKLSKSIKKPEGILSIQPIIDIIEEIINKAGIHALTRPAVRQKIIVTAIRKSTNRIVYFSNDDPEFKTDPINYWLGHLAACAIPGYYPTVPIRHGREFDEYYDAGFKRPLPLLKAVMEGCNTILVSRCHSENVIAQLPDSPFQRLLFSASDSATQLEKEEIKMIRREYPEINLLISEPRHKISETYLSTSFAPGDHEKGIQHGEEIASHEWTPIIEYCREHPRNPPTSA